MNNKIIAWFLKAPSILLITISAGAGWYLSITKQMNIGYATPIILTAILIAFIFGDYLLLRKQKDSESIN